MGNPFGPNAERGVFRTRDVGQADQKVGRDAFVRYEDLMKEMARIKATLEAIAGALSPPTR
jgi:hypothetical protein